MPSINHAACLSAVRYKLPSARQDKLFRLSIPFLCRSFRNAVDRVTLLLMEKVPKLDSFSQTYKKASIIDSKQFELTDL